MSVKRLVILLVIAGVIVSIALGKWTLLLYAGFLLCPLMHIFGHNHSGHNHSSDGNNLNHHH
ncbi:DUF2933 domain-containing protein [Aneurinibacillus terranovensis]|uniref:DUF2933 domain-containing protein n=1 Tax=Aneurinibacillus terranovensis TaxID=278991 RepID=UPI0005510ECB|nr:DUF2933 domain-containing protein [Aneurinibacillus terranovensis]